MAEKQEQIVESSEIPPTMFVIRNQYTLPSDAENLNEPSGKDDLKEFVFSEKTIRRAFIRKVYCILMIQLAISTAVVAFFRFKLDMVDEMLRSVNGQKIVIGALLANVILLLSMSCCEGARRKTPTNYICLFTFTALESFILGIISSRYKTESVLLAIGLCCVICFALTVFSFQTKYDFTTWGVSLYLCILLLFIFGLTIAFMPTKAMMLVYCTIGVALFSLFLIYDTQSLMGGNHKYKISPEEYVFAALCLYIDIIEIFLFLLRIFGSRR